MATARIENFMDVTVLVEMTLGTDRGKWWVDPSFGSNLWLFRQTGKTAPELETDIRQDIEASLSWLKKDGIAKEITCTTEIVGKNRINYEVSVIRPTGATEFIKGVWDGIQSA